MFILRMSCIYRY